MHGNNRYIPPGIRVTGHISRLESSDNLGVGARLLREAELMREDINRSEPETAFARGSGQYWLFVDKHRNGRMKNEIPTLLWHNIIYDFQNHEVKIVDTRR
jgi:hypothetical protein